MTSNEDAVLVMLRHTHEDMLALLDDQGFRVWLDEDEAPITPLDVQQVVDTP